MIQVSCGKKGLKTNVADQPAATADRPFHNARLRRSVASDGSSFFFGAGSLLVDVSRFSSTSDASSSAYSVGEPLTILY
jgi:hypothetical protein